jgi:hypothetical protein
MYKVQGEEGEALLSLPDHFPMVTTRVLELLGLTGSVVAEATEAVLDTSPRLPLTRT